MPNPGPRRAEAQDFFDLKGDLESLLQLGRDMAAFSFTAARHPALHPGQTASIVRDGREVGIIGALHPSLQRELDLRAPLYACEIELAAVLDTALPGFTELSKYPEIRRDLAVVVDKTIPAAELLANVRASAGAYLTDLRLFDVYAGKGIDPKRKSLALGLTFRDQSRTLSDEDVNLAVNQVVDSLQKNYNAELRN